MKIEKWDDVQTLDRGTIGLSNEELRRIYDLCVADSEKFPEIAEQLAVIANGIVKLRECVMENGLFVLWSAPEVKEFLDEIDAIREDE